MNSQPTDSAPALPDSGAATLHALAALLEYPGPDFPARLVAAPFPGQAALAHLSPDRREELYTATFDVTPACVPYTSIHLFGEENFKRGEFMAALHARYAQAGFDSNGELPDHIAPLLRYAAQTDENERRELAAFCLLGPISRMSESLAPTNPYRAVLAAARAELERLCPGVQPAPSPRDQMQHHGDGAPGRCSGCATRTDHDAEPTRTH